MVEEIVMRYVLSIDWLQLWCSGGWHPNGFEYREGDLFSPLLYEYHKENHGTRQFKELWTVSLDGDEIASVQACPCSSIFKADAVCVKFANRVLYLPSLWQIIDDFLRHHGLKVENLTRCDLCADFLTFANNYDPLQLIHDFLNTKIRHIGRGQGGAYFDHGTKRRCGESQYFVNYSGIAFGSHESDARVYLYNKTLELSKAKDKPYIRDLWQSAGLIQFEERDGHPRQKPVWRLEVSIKSKGMHFTDKNTSKKVEVSMDCLRVKEDANWLIESGHHDLSTIYLAFVRQLFAFIRNRPHITNVTREPRITLFDAPATITRATIREKSCSSRAEKILIHSLWNMADRYRSIEQETKKTIFEEFRTRKTPPTCDEIAMRFARNIANTTDLTEWMDDKVSTWDKVLHK